MKKWKALSGTAALVLAFPGPALAEITGMQVWENWIAAGQSMGQTITPGAIEQAGGRMTVRDVQIGVASPEVEVTGTIDFVEFTDQADGTVRVTFPPRYDMTVDIEPVGGEPAMIGLTVGQEGLTMTAAEGAAGGVDYDFEAPEIRVEVTGLEVDGEAIDLATIIALSNATGRYEVGSGDMPTVASRIAAASMLVDVDATNPDNAAETIAFDISMADIEATSEGTMGMMADMTNVAAMLGRGVSTSASMRHGAASYSLEATGSDNFLFAASATGGTFDVSLDAEALAYAFSNTGYEMAISGSEIPLPEITASADEMGFSLKMPVSASETPQDFGFGLSLIGLSVSDMIWGMIDPGGALGRDPATLVFDIAGTANWFFDIMDPAAQTQMMGEIPGELHSLDLNELKLAVVGAELTGTGAFTFDNTDLSTFDGLPAPDGKIDLRLVGANTLIDNLVAMGLLPEDQAMGARMMMGLFARPGDGPDTLVSTIEVKPDGSVLANGQRLQ